MTEPDGPSRDVSVTAGPAGCLVCGQPLPTGRARRYCSDRCRQTGWRRRHQPGPPMPPPPPRPRRSVTVYVCPDCESRYLGEQWCPDCNTWCTRAGIGALCPCCEEPIAIDELIAAMPS